MVCRLGDAKNAVDLIPELIDDANQKYAS